MTRLGSCTVPAAFALALCAGAPGCSACPEQAALLVAFPDYSSPEAAGRSFFAALGCDDAAGEYRALGERLKSRHGATYDAWLLARPGVRDELGAAVQHAHRLDASRTVTSEEGVLVWWTAAGAERVGLLMRAQHYVEFVEDDGRRVGLHLERPPGAWMRLDGKKLALALAVEDAVLRGLDPARVTRITVATEWKIADWMAP